MGWKSFRPWLPGASAPQVPASVSPRPSSPVLCPQRLSHCVLSVPFSLSGPIRKCQGRGRVKPKTLLLLPTVSPPSLPPQNSEEQNSQFQSLEQVKRRPAHLMALLQHVALQFEPGPLVRAGLGQARVVSALGQWR